MLAESFDPSLQDALGKYNLEELPLFNFETLESATDQFSNANKLGRGGFGIVYKVNFFELTYICVFIITSC